MYLGAGDAELLELELDDLARCFLTGGCFLRGGSEAEEEEDEEDDEEEEDEDDELRVLLTGWPF